MCHVLEVASVASRWPPSSLPVLLPLLPPVRAGQSLTSPDHLCLLAGGGGKVGWGGLNRWPPSSLPVLLPWLPPVQVGQSLTSPVHLCLLVGAMWRGGGVKQVIFISQPPVTLPLQFTCTVHLHLLGAGQLGGGGGDIKQVTSIFPAIFYPLQTGDHHLPWQCWCHLCMQVGPLVHCVLGVGVGGQTDDCHHP